MDLSLAGGIAFPLILVIPFGYMRNWEFDSYLFWAGTSVSAVAIVLALIACAVRGADAAVGSALALVGINVLVMVCVILALFSFRMGAP